MGQGVSRTEHQVGVRSGRFSVKLTPALLLPLPACGADLCTLRREGVAVPDAVESIETATHGEGARGAFGSAIAFPAAKTRDDPSGPGEGGGWMGIFLTGGTSFILELERGKEFDLAGFEQVTGIPGYLAIASAHELHDAACRQGGEDREFHQCVSGFQLAGFDVEALAFHHPEQLLDVPAQ